MEFKVYVEKLNEITKSLVTVPCEKGCVEIYRECPGSGGWAGGQCGSGMVKEGFLRKLTYKSSSEQMR